MKSCQSSGVHCWWQQSSANRCVCVLVRRIPAPRECGIPGELCVCHSPSCALREQLQGGTAILRSGQKIPTAPPLPLGQATSTAPRKCFFASFCVLNHLV